MARTWRLAQLHTCCTSYPKAQNYKHTPKKFNSDDFLLKYFKYLAKI